MYKSLRLPNGIPLLLERMDGVRSVALGIWVLAGSRSESREQNGISHLLEHMFFKGTNSHSAQDIAIAIDSIGAELNAFTSKENTAYYIKVMDESIEQGMELLTDIFVDSVFPEDELRREQSVVCEEIRLALDTPDDLVHELFSANMWGESGLGQPVLGTEDTVTSLGRQDLLSYIASSYLNDRIVVACAGNIDEDWIEGFVTEALGGIERKSVDMPPVTSGFKPGLHVHQKDIAETHICLGIEGIPQNSPDRYAALLVNTVLGGGISSRLFQEIREKRGLAYSVYSFLSSYSDTGVWALYAGTAKENVNKVIETAAGEMLNLPDTMGSDELERAKRQLKSTVMFGLESSSRRMQSLANQQIFYGRHYTPEEIIKEIESVSLKQARELAGRLVSSGPMAITVLGPLDKTEISGGISGMAAG